MKFFTCFKRMNQVGAAVVEYAVILAFVAAVGSSFTDNISPGVNNIIKSVSSMLGLAANGSETKTTQQRIYDLFTALNGIPHSGDPSQSLAKDIVSSVCFLEGLARIDTAYAIHSSGITTRAESAGLAIDGTWNYKLITVANQSGVQPTKGNQNDESTHFSATQYLFCQDGKKVYLAATRELDSIYIESEAKHGTFTNSKDQQYTLTNNFNGAKYKEISKTNNETKWVDITNLNSGFVKYEP